jgi:hypothetical protein
VRNAEEVRRLVVQAERLQRRIEGPRLASQYAPRLGQDRLREGRRKRMLQQPADHVGVTQQQRTAQGIQEGEHDRSSLFV